MEKTHTKFYIIITILIAIITFLVGLIVGMFINIKLPTKESSQVSSETVKEVSSVSEVSISTESSVKETTSENPEPQSEVSTVTESTQVAEGGTPVVFQGYQFIIPNDYGVMFTPDMGPLPYMNDLFQIRLVIRAEDDDTFNGFYDNPAYLTEKAVAQGGIIVDECRPVTFKNRDYFVFRVDLGGDDCVVFRTRIDHENSFAGNMVILSDTITEEDYMNVISGLAESIEKSDKPDTTEDEFIGSKFNIGVGTIKEQSTITTKNFKVTYKVPSLFKATDDTFTTESEGETIMYCDTYMTDLFDMADVYVTYYEDGAKSYVADNGRYEGCKLQTLEQNGHTFYYAEKETEEDGVYLQKMLFATDMPGEGWIYYLDIYTNTRFELDDIRDFLYVTVE